jgi:hypothetical protein
VVKILWFLRCYSFYRRNSLSFCSLVLHGFHVGDDNWLEGMSDKRRMLSSRLRNRGICASVSSEISHSLFRRCRGLSNVLGAASSWPAWTPASLLKVANSARGRRFQQVTFQSKLLRQISYSETSPPQEGEVAGGGAIAHPAVILMSRGFDPASHPAKPLVNYQSNRQLSGWNLPPLVKRAIGAHCESHEFRCAGENRQRVGGASPPR